jgi:hypothetical protein
MRLIPQKSKAWIELGYLWSALPEWHIPELGEGSFKMVGGATREDAIKRFYTQNNEIALARSIQDQ